MYRDETPPFSSRFSGFLVLLFLFGVFGGFGWLFSWFLFLSMRRFNHCKDDLCTPHMDSLPLFYLLILWSTRPLELRTRLRCWGFVWCVGCLCVFGFCCLVVWPCNLDSNPCKKKHARSARLSCPRRNEKHPSPSGTK